MPYRPLFFFCLAALFWSGADIPAQEKVATPEEQARKVCEQFGRAIFARDFEAAAKLVADPWYDNGDGAGKGRVTRGAVGLKNRLKQIFKEVVAARDGTFKDVNFEGFIIRTYEQAAKEIKADERKMLDEVLKKTDREVHLRFIMTITVDVVSADGVKRSRVLTVGRPFIMMVGWRDGQARVVGIRFGL